jgi:hypothetical protein
MCFSHFWTFEIVTWYLPILQLSENKYEILKPNSNYLSHRDSIIRSFKTQERIDQMVIMVVSASLFDSIHDVILETSQFSHTQGAHKVQAHPLPNMQVKAYHSQKDTSLHTWSLTSVQGQGGKREEDVWLGVISVLFHTSTWLLPRFEQSRLNLVFQCNFGSISCNEALRPR